MVRRKTINDIEIEKKNIVIRIDIDSSFVEDEFLIPQKVLRYKETFDYFIYNKAKVAVIFEMGKNRSRYNSKLSVESIISQISEMTETVLTYFSGENAKDIEYALEEILPGEILFFENLALTNEEEKDQSVIFDKLKEWAEIFVNDAFGVSSRDYNSFKKLAEETDSYAGLVLSEEMTRLAEILTDMERPLTAVLGGLKLTPYMVEQVLALSEKVDNVLLTGAWVPYYLNATGELEMENWMDKKVAKLVEKNISDIIDNANIHVPVDVTVYKDYENGERKSSNVPIDFIKNGLKVGDIGNETVDYYENIISESNFVIWIGNVGKWWENGLSEGTKSLYEIIEGKYINKILVGDDLIESLIGLDMNIDRFSYVHFGDGGSILNFIFQGEIIGVDRLKQPWNI